MEYESPEGAMHHSSRMWAVGAAKVQVLGDEAGEEPRGANPDTWTVPSLEESSGRS